MPSKHTGDQGSLAELPRSVKAYIERHSNGGVANRNAD
jgi:hypothetical protein